MDTLLELLDPLPSPALTLTSPNDAARHVKYLTLRDFVSGFRNKLVQELGVRKGDVIASSLVNGLEFVVTFLGTGIARAIAAPLNPTYSVDEVKFYLEDTKPTLLVLPVLSTLYPGSGISKGAQNALQAAKEVGVRVAEISILEEDRDILLRVIYRSGLFSGVKDAGRKLATVGVPIRGTKLYKYENPSPDDITLVLHTSGTTGRPKSVPLSHLNLITTMKNITQTYSLQPTDKSLLVMPLFHVHGLLAGLLSPLRSRGTVVIPTPSLSGSPFSASTFWKDFISEGCTWYTAVPTIHTILLNTPLPNTLPKIKFIRSCSSSLSPSTLRALEERFKAPVLEAYAMTEAAHQMTSNLAPFSRVKSEKGEGGERVPGTVGVGVGVEVCIRDVGNGREVKRGELGEVCVRGKNVTKGYWAGESVNREAFWEGGWFRTGDQGFIQPNPPHHLQLTGRLKELINRGGEKVSPLEIDHALLGIKGVGEAVAFGVPDDKYGEIVWAAVVLKSGNAGEALGKNGDEVEKRLQGELGTKLSKFKIPTRILVTESIPKTATGKVQRRHVRDAFLGREKRSSAVKAKL
ncbi:uncharacterized protein EI90DRAFT_3146656 [Cantharellus anzutake]|uniref:uncharacterized protein n=1 Tax=Cantharellus anzutake TaxID=1750568 RepID=UPI001905D0F7|nr:uncharacterized protein EI90DRAFT_3146656 [Cantharellus anzutake]KAF8325627.1 hypothetical protein EI90DRAFT_3146656 [Cantharellus anzutake]